jgi:hypothetical protein
MGFSRGFADYDAGNPYGRASYEGRSNAVGKYMDWFLNGKHPRYEKPTDIGITGFAHEAPPGERDCSTMPAAVTDLLVARGCTVPQPPDVEALRAAG